MRPKTLGLAWSKRCVSSARFRSPNVFWIDSHHKRYVAAVGDYVIGHVMSKIGVDFFRLDIGAAQVTHAGR